MKIKSFLFFSYFFHLVFSLKEAPDGSGFHSLSPSLPLSLSLFPSLSLLLIFSVCFNGCSGHGDCVDYSCHCWIGYHGDDCSVCKSHLMFMWLAITSLSHSNSFITKALYPYLHTPQAATVRKDQASSAIATMGSAKAKNFSRGQTSWQTSREIASECSARWCWEWCSRRHTRRPFQSNRRTCKDQTNKYWKVAHKEARVSLQESTT